MNRVTAAGSRHLIFEVGAPRTTQAAEPPGADVFGLAVESVQQVIEAETVSPVPLAPVVVEGIINHRGRIVTVVDPGPMLGLDGQPEPATQVVILRRPDAAPANLGLKVLRIRGIVPSEQLHPTDVTPGPCVLRVAQWETQLVHLVDAEALLGALSRQFLSAAANGRSRSDSEGAIA